MIRVFVLLLALIALVGCGSVGGPKKEDLVGTWEGKIDMPADQKDNPFAKMAEAMATMTLEVKSDDTFSLAIMGMPIAGKYAFAAESRTLTLTPESFMGMSMADVQKEAEKGGKGDALKANDPSEPMVLKLSQDGKELLLEDTGPDGQPANMTFVRKEPAK